MYLYIIDWFSDLFIHSFIVYFMYKNWSTISARTALQDHNESPWMSQLINVYVVKFSMVVQKGLKRIIVALRIQYEILQEYRWLLRYQTTKYITSMWRDEGGGGGGANFPNVINRGNWAKFGRIRVKIRAIHPFFTSYIACQISSAQEKIWQISRCWVAVMA